MTNMSLLLDNPFTFHGDDSIDQCNVGDSAWWILFFPPSPLSVDADATNTIHLLSRDQVIRWLQNRYEKSAKQFIHDPPIPLGQWQQINARSIMFRSRQAGYYMCTNSSTGNNYTRFYNLSSWFMFGFKAGHVLGLTQQGDNTYKSSNKLMILDNSCPRSFVHKSDRPRWEFSKK